jgi:UDP-3-O-[3-hydroxymyristoyl] glucosamine N-acyltransferase
VNQNKKEKEMREKKYFEVEIDRYIPGDNRKVYRPASLNNPKHQAVMFVTETFLSYADALLRCKDCLVMWPKHVKLPENITKRHAVYCVDDPHNAFAYFFKENGITYLPKIEEYEVVNGAYIAKTAIIGRNCKIFPGAYVGGEVILGDNVYIGTGTKLLGEICVGNNVVIRENTVIGADGLTTDRDEDGKALTIPQFGGVVIEDNVQIGALTVIGRGAIDNTIIRRGAKIDNSCFISHNVTIDEDAFIVGETIMFGSSSLGKQGYISGNATIRDGCHVGEKAKVGMGAVVTKNVDEGTVVKGNPAK